MSRDVSQFLADIELACKKVAHEHFGISEELIWDIVQNEIQPLLKSVKIIIKNL